MYALTMGVGEEFLERLRVALGNKWYSTLASWWIFTGMAAAVGEFAGLWRLSPIAFFLLVAPCLILVLWPVVVVMRSKPRAGDESDRET